MCGHFYGIGAGPGDPDLLTLKAIKILEKVDVLAVPESKGRSIVFEIVKPYLREDIEIIILSFPMIFDREKKNQIHLENSKAVKRHLLNNKDVAFITLGDPLTFSTYTYLLEELKNENLSITTVPGISSYNGIAAGLNLPLVIGKEHLALFSGIENLDLSLYMDSFDCLVFMKPTMSINKIISLYNEYEGQFSFNFATNYSMADEIIIRDTKNRWKIKNEKDLLEMMGLEKIPYLSTIILRRKNVRT